MLLKPIDIIMKAEPMITQTFTVADYDFFYYDDAFSASMLIGAPDVVKLGGNKSLIMSYCSAVKFAEMHNIDWKSLCQPTDSIIGDIEVLNVITNELYRRKLIYLG